jgi:hypothetical protein
VEAVIVNETRISALDDTIALAAARGESKSSIGSCSSFRLRHVVGRESTGCNL